MNLILIYGPPAAGKQTVSYELSEMTGYKIFRNRDFNSCLADIFPYNTKLNPIMHKLTAKFRIEIYEEAAKENVSFITCYGASGEKRFRFFRNAIKALEKYNGKILFVQLLPKREVLSRRVIEKSRGKNKIRTKKLLGEYLDNNPDSFDKFPDAEHITINNTHLSPKEVAKQILSYYKV